MYLPRKMTVTVVLLMIALFSLWFVQADEETIDRGLVNPAAGLIGLEFTESEIDTMLGNLTELQQAYQTVRAQKLDNSVVPALQFNPLPVGYTPPSGPGSIRYSDYSDTRRPENLEDAAFFSVGQLAWLIKSGQVSSEELTRMYLKRLKIHDKKLHCVITLTEELALMQARRADKELKEGKYRGPLHGIPYGAKDLLAKKGYKTTWGAEPFKDQVIDEDAAVIEQLEAAGAVLVAKLTLGALAWGDVWYGEKTRNPWNLEQGSSGSSAGSASATSAGLVGFSIGTETWGSIVSPANRCGVTGLRPTYGRVSRRGAMALSWSMDKIGPICRTVEGCAMVFEAINVPDEQDQSLIQASYRYQPEVDFSDLKIGYLKEDFDGDYPNNERDNVTLELLRKLGATLVPMALPQIPFQATSFILSAEAAAAFDDLTLSGKDDLMVRQIRNAWPNTFRYARLIPAVEYINANRLRFQLIQAHHQKLQEVDLYVAPSFSANLLMTNLTGHPCVVLPNGFDENGAPTSITFMGNLFDEGLLMAVARGYQEKTDFHLQRPAL